MKQIKFSELRKMYNGSNPQVKYPKYVWVHNGSYAAQKDGMLRSDTIGLSDRTPREKCIVGYTKAQKIKILLEIKEEKRMRYAQNAAIRHLKKLGFSAIGWFAGNVYLHQDGGAVLKPQNVMKYESALDVHKAIGRYAGMMASTVWD